MSASQPRMPGDLQPERRRGTQLHVGKPQTQKAGGQSGGGLFLVVMWTRGDTTQHNTTEAAIPCIPVCSPSSLLVLLSITFHNPRRAIPPPPGSHCRTPPTSNTGSLCSLDWLVHEAKSSWIVVMLVVLFLDIFFV